MREIEINILSKLPDEVIEKRLDDIDKYICNLLETEDVLIITKEYKDEA